MTTSAPEYLWLDMEGRLRLNFRYFGKPGDKIQDCHCGGAMILRSLLVSDIVCAECGGQHDSLDSAVCERCGLTWDGVVQ